MELITWKIKVNESNIKLSRSDVQFISTELSAVPGPMSSRNRHSVLHCFMLVIPKLLLCNVWFITLKIRYFLENQFGSDYSN